MHAVAERIRIARRRRTEPSSSPQSPPGPARGDGNLDVIDVLTAAQRGLHVLLKPLPPEIGGFRKLLAQNRVDGFLGM
jgi:hypothetical protein